MNVTAVADALGRHHRAFTLVGVVLLVLAAWMAAIAYAAPTETTRIDRDIAWTERAAFTYSVPVTRNSTLWPIGTRLPMGEPAYFRTVSDSIDVDYEWMPESGDPQAQGVAGGRLSVHVVATAYDGRPYWSIDRTLDEATTANATQGLRLSGRVALDELHNDLLVLNSEMPVAEGTINWSVRASVVYAFDAGGRRDQGETERILPITASDPRYVLPEADELRWTEEHSQDRVTTQTKAAGVPGILGAWRPLALGGLGLALLVAGTWFARAPDGEPFDRELRRFREWVSTAGRIPDHSADAAATIDVRSLEDLIHVAADARTRVVLDERSRVFYAFLPGATYRYARHAY